VQGDLVAWGLHRFASRFINPILTGRQTGQGQSENGSPIWWNDASAPQPPEARGSLRASRHTKAGPRKARNGTPALSQNPADNRIDLAWPIQSETAPNKFQGSPEHTLPADTFDTEVLGGKLPVPPTNVCDLRRFGRHMLALSFTPKPTSDVSAMSGRALANAHPDRSSCRLTRNYSPQTLINLHRCVQPEGSVMDLQMNGKTAGRRDSLGIRKLSVPSRVSRLRSRGPLR
jgi:hypothetical protein